MISSDLLPPIASERELALTLQKTVSASRLSLFLQCRLKFYFRYVKRLAKAKSPALHLGGCVHSTLKAWNMARWRKAPLTEEQLQQEFASAWENEDHVGIDWLGKEEETKKMGWGLVTTYLRETNIAPEQSPDAVEVPIEADLSSHGLPLLVGILDLVQGGVIIDYKTSATTPNGDNAAHVHQIQATSYSVLFRECNRKAETGIEIHTLVKLKTPKLVISALPTVTEARKLRLFRLMESYLSGLDRGDWVPSPGLLCAGCEYFGECQQWQ